MLNQPESVSERTRAAVVAAIEELGYQRGAVGTTWPHTGGATTSPPGSSNPPLQVGTQRRPDRPASSLSGRHPFRVSLSGAATPPGEQMPAGHQSGPTSLPTVSDTATRRSWKS
ncbi:helix-turn-helix domain-containing protein [Rugosimonospora acidiphila]|uniref:hypothetical protein n=1 Tax=Rugosimonospora acidiphila TaxID=556531 RepID=UPI0031E8A1B6